DNNLTGPSGVYLKVTPLRNRWSNQVFKVEEMPKLIIAEASTTTSAAITSCTTASEAAIAADCAVERASGAVARPLTKSSSICGRGCRARYRVGGFLTVPASHTTGHTFYVPRRFPEVCNAR